MADIGTTTRPIDPSDLGELSRLRVLVISDAGAVTRVLPSTGEVTIGRGEDCGLQIDDVSISRHHARLSIGPILAIEDLGSKNGTRVRGEPLAEGTRVQLAPDDVIQAGTVTVIVQGKLSLVRGAAPAAPTDPMERIDALVKRIAPSSISVLFLGETGVGKEVLARELHGLSPRADRPFCGINCAALSDQLLESELFGHERGAFTSAVQAKPGLLEAADGGTVFLDEIGDLPINLQAKLLRVLEERVVRRVGSVEARPIDVRFLAATNRDLKAAMEAGDFRQDLFFRLAGITIEIPPLRDRRGEIAALARMFLEQAAQRDQREPVPVVDADALAWLQTYPWPGNLRELRNMMERALLLAEGDSVTTAQLPTDTSAAPQTSRPLDQIHDERERIIAALEECGGNQTRAAKRLGIARRTLIKRLDTYGLPRPQKRGSED